MNFSGTINQINFIIVFQGFFLAAGLLFLKKGDQTLNRILALLLITFSWSGFYYNIDMMGKMHSYTGIAYTNVISDYLYNPLMFLYVLRLTKKGLRFDAKIVLHFIPAFFMALYYLNYYFAPTSEKATIFERGYNYFPYDVAVFSYVNLIQLVVYLSISAAMLNRYGKAINQVYSNIVQRNHNWLKFILIINTIAAVICFFIYGTRLENLGLFLSVLSALLVYAIGYKMISAPPHLPEVEIESPVETINSLLVSESPSGKYERSGLSEERGMQLAEKIRRFMREEKPYLNPEINLRQLADLLGVPLHHVSQVLNQQIHKSFYDYVNEFRVEEVKSKLGDSANNHLTILAIGLDSGFNSKASFNSVFKKFTGKSPSAYKKAIFPEVADM